MCLCGQRHLHFEQLAKVLSHTDGTCNSPSGGECSDAVNDRTTTTHSVLGWRDVGDTARHQGAHVRLNFALSLSPGHTHTHTHTIHSWNLRIMNMFETAILSFTDNFSSKVEKIPQIVSFIEFLFSIVPFIEVIL